MATEHQPAQVIVIPHIGVNMKAVVDEVAARMNDPKRGPIQVDQQGRLHPTPFGIVIDFETGEYVKGVTTTVKR